MNQQQTVIYVRKGTKPTERAIGVAGHLEVRSSSEWLKNGYAIDGTQVFKLVPQENLYQEESYLLSLFHEHGIEPRFA